MITRTTYGGWANNVILSNGHLELLATLDVGPRLLRFGLVGGPNVLKEFPEQLGGSGEAEWVSRGGHRLWHAPEEKPRTYWPDNAPVAFEALGELAMRLTPPPETANGLQLQLEVQMCAESDELTITHRLTNIARWEITPAAWTLSVMDAGGTAIVPLPPKRPHTEVLAPGFPLVLWPYTDLSDARLHFYANYLTLTQVPGMGPTKLGAALSEGWAAYQVHGQLFVKYFDYLPCATYPDYGCNFEMFTNESMLEVETLGPLTPLAPGECLEHVETWRLFADVPAVTDEASILRNVLPRVKHGCATDSDVAK